MFLADIEVFNNQLVNYYAYALSVAQMSAIYGIIGVCA